MPSFSGEEVVHPKHVRLQGFEAPAVAVPRHASLLSDFFLVPVSSRQGLVLPSDPLPILLIPTPELGFTVGSRSWTLLSRMAIVRARRS